VRLQWMWKSGCVSAFVDVERTCRVCNSLDAYSSTLFTFHLSRRAIDRNPIHSRHRTRPPVFLPQ
jgi:hypothetical protein